MDIGELPQSIAKGKKLFKKTVIDANKSYRRWKITEIDPCLDDNIDMRGELILFRKINGKYPVFQKGARASSKKPQADFRGVLRVNGDDYVTEICECYMKEKVDCIPQIPYCK